MMATETKDCKTCRHGTALYEIEKGSRYEGTHRPSGFARCAGPRYGGRKFFVRDNRKGCPDYEKRERKQ